MFADVLTAIGQRFGRNHGAAAVGVPREPMPATNEDDLAAANFRTLGSDFEHRKIDQEEEARRLGAEQRHQHVKDLIDHHIGDENWRSMLHLAREAAERGEREFPLLRFPADLCSDHGRAINAPMPEWPETLRGEAAEVYLRWERDLKPRGFHLAARVLDFPNGFPGDIGLFLLWGE